MTGGGGCGSPSRDGGGVARRPRGALGGDPSVARSPPAPTFARGVGRRPIRRFRAVYASPRRSRSVPPPLPRPIGVPERTSRSVDDLKRDPEPFGGPLKDAHVVVTEPGPDHRRSERSGDGQRDQFMEECLPRGAHRPYRGTEGDCEQVDLGGRSVRVPGVDPTPSPAQMADTCRRARGR